MTLLRFKNEFTVNNNYSDMYDDVLQNGPSYPKTNSWNINIDCCSWDGVICDSSSGHVIGLDLSCSQLGGIISSNTSLFRLSHLKTLNLAYNYLYPSRIPPVIGNLTNLKYLNLSHTGFVGEVPIEFAALSQLVSLDLTIPTLVGSEVEIFTMMSLPYLFSGLKFPDFDKIVRNLTNLQQLHLNGVVINSSIPQILENFSSLTSLQLYNCSLQGTFPSKISTLPNLHSLIVELNPNLYVHTSLLKNLSSSLQVLDFAYTNISGRLPDCSPGFEPNLRMFSVSGCNLWGQIPVWVWNTSEVLMLADNLLSGDLPATMDTKKTQNLQSITNIALSNNLLKGIIPSWLFTLPSLIELNLRGNQFCDMVKEGFLLTEDCLQEYSKSNIWLSEWRRDGL
ncbi:unnamed protein product [Amaranthus hypochondriacus]